MTKKLSLLALVMFVILGCGLFDMERDVPTEPPIKTEKPTDEIIPIPTTIQPTKTFTPEPIVTTEPISGDLLYETTFDEIINWEIVTFNNTANYVNEVRSNGLYVKVPDKNDYWFAYHSFGDNNGDVRIEMDAELVGNNNYTYISVICRASEKGEYYFTLDTGGYWQIGKYDYKEQSYEQLDYGGSTRIRVAKDTNHITAICEGDELTLKINDYNIGSVRDAQFTNGDVGIGVETFDYPLTEVVFHNLEVYVP